MRERHTQRHRAKMPALDSRQPYAEMEKCRAWRTRLPEVASRMTSWTSWTWLRGGRKGRHTESHPTAAGRAQASLDSPGRPARRPAQARNTPLKYYLLGGCVNCVHCVHCVLWMRGPPLSYCLQCPSAANAVAGWNMCAKRAFNTADGARDAANDHVMR